MAVSTRASTPIAPRALLSAFSRAAQAAEYVAAAYHDTYFNAALLRCLYLFGVFIKAFHVYAISLFAHKALSTQFEEYSFKLCHVYK